MRLKGVNPGSQILYGPRRIGIQLGNVTVPWDVYEADIDDNCLLGSDFIYKYKVHLDPDMEVIRFRPQPDAPQEVVPFQWEHSSSKGLFDSGRVYYQIRVGKYVSLQPFEAKTLELSLLTDSAFDQEGKSIADRLVLARSISARYQPSPVDVQSTEQKYCSVNVQTQVCSTHKTRECSSRSVKVGNINTEPNEPDLDSIQLGVITSPVDFVPINARVPDGVMVRSGVIPCINAPMKVEIINLSDNAVRLPNRAVIAEVYLMNPASYNNTCEEAIECEKVTRTVKGQIVKIKYQ